MVSENLLLSATIGVSIVRDIGFSVAVGSVLVLLRGDGALHLTQKLHRILGICAGILLLSAPVQLVLLTFSMTGASTFAELKPQINDVLTSTHAGRILLPQFWAAVLLVACTLLPLRRTLRVGSVTLCILLYAIFKAASGHAASDGDYTFRELSQCVHLLSVSAWSGGVLLAGWFALPRLRTPTEKLQWGRQLSMQSAIAIVLVFASGLVNTWLGVAGDVKVFISSRWGYLLLTKVLFTCVALALGVMNRRDLLATDAMDRMARFSRRVYVEAWWMIAILFLSGWLANVAPVS